MKKAIVMQVLIFIGAYFAMTPDTLEDNTHLFGLFGDVEVIKGNTIWVMSIALVATIINIWFWWPKTQVTSTSEAPAAAESTKSVEAAAEVKTEVIGDPAVPKMD